MFVWVNSTTRICLEPIAKMTLAEKGSLGSFFSGEATKQKGKRGATGQLGTEPQLMGASGKESSLFSWGFLLGEMATKEVIGHNKQSNFVCTTKS